MKLEDIIFYIIATFIIVFLLLLVANLFNLELYTYWVPNSYLKFLNSLSSERFSYAMYYGNLFSPRKNWKYFFYIPENLLDKNNFHTYFSLEDFFIPTRTESVNVTKKDGKLKCIIIKITYCPAFYIVSPSRKVLIYREGCEGSYDILTDSLEINKKIKEWREKMKKLENIVSTSYVYLSMWEDKELAKVYIFITGKIKKEEEKC